MIQHRPFHDGTFVLHKVQVNGHKYSVWYGKDGKPFSAERVMNDGNTVNVPGRQVNVWARFAEIGKPYVGK